MIFIGNYFKMKIVTKLCAAALLRGAFFSNALNLLQMCRVFRLELIKGLNVRFD